MGTLQRVSTRVKQFRRALTAKLEPSDCEFLNKYLGEQEKALFFQMDRIDQRHCLDVAQYAYREATARGLGNRRFILVKAALLHDIGKVSSAISLSTRILYVLRRPSEEEQRTGIRWKGLYSHAERGAHMAEVFGVETDVAHLIRVHHLAEPGTDEARILQEADELY